VEGAPGGGYALTGLPDRLYPEELIAGDPRRWLGREVHYLEETDSTNRVAFELARNGAASGVAVIAEHQTAGRGRLGRAFFSPARRNLYTSIVLRPDITIAEAPTLILASAIGVAEAVAATLEEAERVEIKWPNDVLIDGLKTSGILMEMNAEATKVGFVILGIGVNLNVDRDEFPAEFRARATSLAAASGRRVDRIAFTRRLYGILEDVFDLHAENGFASLRGRFDPWFRMPGRAVEVHGMGNETLTGTAVGIAPDGALEVERADGRIERVIAGDVTLSGSGSPR
jgi:BirA family biotin operon repressor/biotin-[acetyl-CoA-carboxylase] ligase